MGKGKITLLILCVLLCLSSCNKDDGGNDIPVIPLRDRAEQQLADIDSLQAYLKTHYFNSTEIANAVDASISDIKITKLGEGETTAPPDHTLLIESNQLDSMNVTFADTDYKYYLLKLRQGGGDKSPSFADNIRLLYEGFLSDGDVFDESQNPVDFDLTTLIPGWRKVIPQFNIAESFVEVGDGTVDYVNGGLGIMFLPSGLAYFSNATAGIPSYTPIMFKFELFQSFENDHDGDGIPSYLEDLPDENGKTDGEFTANPDQTIHDDDTDNDNVPNYFDPDDDGDRVPTRDELESKTYSIDTNQGESEPVLDEKIEFVVSRVDNSGVITLKTLKIVDSNNDGIGDHLDADIKIENNKD